MESSENPGDLENPEEIIDEITSNLDEIHEDLVKVTTNFGHARDAMRASRQIWVDLSNSDTSDPNVLALYRTNYEFLETYRNEISSFREMNSETWDNLNSVAGTASAFYTSSGSTAAFVGLPSDYSIPKYRVTFLPEQHEEFSIRLSTLDKSLGDTYQEIWEILYGTRADPERGALYLIRQSFDQLFSKLAPDAEVRKSLFWKEKDGEKPNQIWRDERIQYAAHMHIKDDARRNTILASSKHMINVYQALNRAHNRDEIDREKARASLEEMRTFLEDWVNAIDI